MTEQASTGIFDFEALREAVEHGDADALASLYADGADRCVLRG